jgi:hypothetical protein
MNIQSSIASYNSSQSYKSAQQRDISSVPTERSTISETNYATNVTISDEAKALLANTSAPTQERTDAQKELLQIAASDRSTAVKLASDMANSQSRVFFDIRGQRGVGDGQGEFALKLSSTGKIVDDEYVAKFNKEASAIDEQRKLIYNTERAKGTDPLKILEKMIDFTNTQSQDYLEATGWIAKQTA